MSNVEVAMNNVQDSGKKVKKERKPAKPAKDNDQVSEEKVEKERKPAKPAKDNDQVSEEKVEKERKPTMTIAMKRCMIFAFNLINQLNESGLLSDKEGAMDSAQGFIQLMSSPEDQLAFYTKFLEDSTTQGKIMNKYVKDKIKAAKALVPKEKKPRAPRKPKVQSESEAETDGEPKEKKPRKPRAKKEVNVVNDTDANIIGELVAAAAVENTVVEPAAEAVAPKAKKPRAKKAEPVTTEAPVAAAVEAPAPAPKEKKPRAKKADKAPVPVTETVAVATPAPKEKKPRAKKGDKAPEPAPVPAPVEELTVDDADDDENIQTREFVLNGVDYLIDDDNNVYTVDESHDLVGVYNPATKTINPVEDD